jgi:predicted acylesterase/phospholipase RssA
MSEKIVRVFYRLSFLVALAIAEMREASSAFKQVLKEWRNMFIRLVLRKYKALKLLDKMDTCSTHDEWEKYAKQLDILSGRNEYKFKLESRLYDYERIDSRYRIMKQLRKSKNVKTLAHALRQDLVKNIGGICEPRLYNQCFLGTKRVIEKYHNEVIKCIQTIYYAKPSKMSFESKL